MRFDSRWRFNPPQDGRYTNRAIPREALGQISEMIGKTATQGDRWQILEHFKAAFCRASGVSHSWSSSEGWAESDMDTHMLSAAENAPVFLEAFHDACEALAAEGIRSPDVQMINEFCQKNSIGYILCPPDILSRERLEHIPVAVEEEPRTIEEEAYETLQKSLQRSEELLVDGRSRESVQEVLWVLESLSTAFRGLETMEGPIRGRYFNEILKDLRRSAKGSTLECVAKWIGSLHGFLSSPTGGGIRHGLDLRDGVSIGPNEARLFCNLIRSYVVYLLREHERLALRPQDDSSG